MVNCCVRRCSRLPGVVALAVVLAACGGGGARPVTRPAATQATAAFAGLTRPYTLCTHCGIGEARIGNGYFEAVHPLSDGAGNPPVGWGDPFQQGTMTMLSPAMAVFRDDAGHRVVFRLRPGATSFRHLCD